ncbi:tyrosine-protein phosphatase [Microbacterium nymphoidis]|uniref:tyrosine-protein phosphatase n=1 Tax=Microbacterium nymphoidis TaxID=2898586 RepID=UPI001E3A6AD0|nr:tyrosine-protein phosphatase [Microbacterium nymphoidis]MCD2497822.1 tyrosine-protein phosphatase [Microbacterium nymphoidis]
MTPLIPGTHNSRDVGGLPLAGGGSIAAGVLYRSDALAAVTDAGLEVIASSPIGTIIDFRTESERAEAPNRLPAGVPIAEHHLSLLEGALPTGAAPTPGMAVDAEMMRRMLERIPSISQLYLAMLQHAAPAFADVARSIASPENADRPGVLVHCTAGKDRTGVATALMLDIAGAERDAVVDDYAQSEQNLSGAWAEAMTARVAAMGVPLVPAVTELLSGTPREAIESAFAWIDERGGSAAYLRSGGLDDDTIAGVQARLRS